MFHIFRKLGLLNLFIFLLTFSGSFQSLKSNASQIELSKNNPKSQENINSKIEVNTEYILDSGDVLFINFSGLQIFSGSYPISFEGTIFLPELGEINIKGYTIQQLKDELSERYKTYLKNTKIDIILEGPRPLNISIIGEVKRPGLYQLKPVYIEIPQSDISKSSYNNLSNIIVPRNNILFPRVFKALQTSFGVTSKADLTKVIIIRNNPEINGGGKIKTTIDIISLLKDGDQSQNIELRDGDTILIQESNQPIFEQFLSINKSNLSPDEIRVYVNGNIESPGALTLPQNSSLYEAISAAGGEKNSSGKIEFLRFDEKGSTDKRILPFNRKITKGSEGNPILVDGDIIIVRKNIIGKITTSINTIGTPIINAYGIYSIID